ncbi:MAG: hypothetical protein JW973_07505 [Bacteroidales bacterium]|nr:hypothetical protein [Bacteroidales bacterium]
MIFLLKRWNFKISLLLLSGILSGLTDLDGQLFPDRDSARYLNYLPDHVILQYAGGIGFVSVGTGYTFFNQRFELSCFYGYVPEWFSAEDLHSVCLQLSAKLIRIKINHDMEILPINFGGFVHHTFGKEYWTRLPSHYPEDYYFWSPGLVPGIILSMEVKTKLLNYDRPSSGISFYANLGSRFIYIENKLGNSSIPFKDIIEFGFGVEVYL